ncbi:MAG: Fe-S cluster assembly protein SufD [Actinobacteria bacterium]|nr:Fe-S cluster assembly protein SufD [Actinomycetota bacterium]
MSQHGIKEHSHGNVPIQTRSERPRSTSVADFEPISKLQEIWRYLPIDKLRGLDADVMAEVADSDFELKLVSGVTHRYVESTDSVVGSAGLPEDRVSAAAWTNASKTLVIEIPADFSSSEASFVKLSPAGVSAKAAHLVVKVGNFANATVVLDHVGLGVLAENVEIVLGDGSQLNFVSIQQWDQGASHISSQFARLGRDSKLKHVVVSLGGDLVRVTPTAFLANQGAEVEMFGVYLADTGNYFEHRPFVDHIAKNCVSNVAYKGALQGAGAHTVWVGDVLIRESAEGTDTYELNRNLLLVDGARADSVPNLEIETGKIEGAGHASASGRFDDEQLFYLMARGVSESDARKLVVRGFLNEVIQKIGIEEIEQRLISAIELELERVGA